MIDRYTRPAMGALWTDHARMEAWRAVEVAACEEMDGPTAEDLEAIRAATFTVAAVQEREAVTDHDVAAFVDVLSASAGPSGRWIHYGLTSSDVLDTALARAAAARRRDRPRRRAGAGRRARRAGARARGHDLRRPHPRRARRADDVRHQARRLRDGGRPQPRPPAARVRRGRVRRDQRRRRHVLGDRPGLRARACCAGSTWRPSRSRRRSSRATATPQLLQAVALAGAGLERLATEIRHLQRTEVLEAREPFRSGQQKGSSAMPHKRNPITTERITGLARVLRGNAQAAIENVALWHERDISHSGAERVIIPDSLILIDYLQHLAIRVVSGLVVDADRMRANIDLTHGALFSQRVLLALVAQGRTRDEAYRIAQESAQEAWDTGTPLRDLLAARDLGLDLDDVFDMAHYTRHAHEIVGRLDAIAAGLTGRTIGA